MPDVSELFEEAIELPNAQAQRRLDDLVGLDDVKDRLIKEARLLLDPLALKDWQSKFHSKADIRIDLFAGILPFFIFAGDVGTGKTALAETFGNSIARQLDISITVYRLSLRARGQGVVGQMTKLLADAFSYISGECKRWDKQLRKAGILLIDEGDALAQSRDQSQMHHEDRAGVNALIRGLNELAESDAAAMVVLCTNRPDSIDPAIERRAVEVVRFQRPGSDERRAVLEPVFAAFGLSNEVLEQAIHKTGPLENRQYGFTYSDLKQRFLRNLVLSAYPNCGITDSLALNVLAETVPSRPFAAET